MVDAERDFQKLVSMNATRMTLVYSCLILLLASGCAGPQKASNPAGMSETQNPLRNVSVEAVHSLVMPPPDADGRSVGKTVVIDNEKLVQGLFKEIQKAPLQRSTHRLM